MNLTPVCVCSLRGSHNALEGDKSHHCARSTSGTVHHQDCDRHHVGRIASWLHLHGFRGAWHHHCSDLWTVPNLLAPLSRLLPTKGPADNGMHSFASSSCVSRPPWYYRVSSLASTLCVLTAQHECSIRFHSLVSVACSQNSLAVMMSGFPWHMELMARVNMFTKNVLEYAGPDSGGLVHPSKRHPGWNVHVWVVPWGGVQHRPRRRGGVCCAFRGTVSSVPLHLC